MTVLNETTLAPVERRPFDALGTANHGWLDTHFHFSFAGYHDPARLHWGAIRVWNDDWIAAGAGFPPHPHADMEIITYVRKGAISHRDSLGNEGKTGAGDVQVMSAGSGVTHAEFNAEDEPCELFQIWIIPEARGGEPGWGMKPFPKADRSGKLQLLASGFGEEDALSIRASARLHCATLAAGSELRHNIGEGRCAYLVPATGSVDVNGTAIETRDGAAIGAGEIVIRTDEPTELVLVEAAA